MSDVTTNNGLNQSCGSETCTLTGEKVCTDEPQQLPTINYDKLFSQLLNMNLLNQCKQEQEQEQDDEGYEGDEGDEDEDDEDYEDEDEGDEDSNYSDEGFSLDAKWKTINKLVESHLNITNSIATLLNNS
jgi:hypothetical protein